MGGFKHGGGVGQIGPGCDAYAAHFRRECIRDIVTIEVEGGDYVVVFRPQEYLLQEGVGDHILDDDAVRQFYPGAGVYRFACEFAHSQIVAPLLEATLGELHDVALVHQGHRAAMIVDGVLDGAADQAFGTFHGHRLDADGGGFREANLRDAHHRLQKLDDLFHFRRAGFPLHACVDVLGVLAEDHHVDPLRVLDRRGYALEVTHRPQAHVEIQYLAQGHVEGTHAAGSGGGQRPLDGNDVVAQRLHGFFGQPVVGAIDPGRFFAGIDFHPLDPALSAVSAGDGCIEHGAHDRCDVGPCAIALDEGDNRPLWHVQASIGIDADRAARGGRLYMATHDNSFNKWRI